MHSNKVEISNFLVSLKLFMPAGEASVSPPLGPMLSQYGMNTIQFCKEFNESTVEFTSFFNNECNNDGGVVEKKQFILVVYVYMYIDKTFMMEIMKPTIQFLLITFLCMDMPKPNKLLYTMGMDDLILLAKFKFPQLKLFSACMLVSGVASSLGIRIKS